MTQYPALLIVAPLLAALFIIVGAWFNRKVSFAFGNAGLAVSFASTILLLVEVMTNGPISYRLGGWAPPFGIEYYIDHLNAVVLVLISGVGFFNLLATGKVISREYGEKTPAFYALYLLAVAGHLGIVVTGDAFNLYVLLEISALSGYALLAMGSSAAPLATLRYLFMGTVGASFYLLGVGYLYIKTGSLNMLDLAGILPGLTNSPTILAAFGLILVGVWVKMAFFPLHAWLPGAYSNAFSPAASLIAPLTTKVMVYVMIRMMLTVFSADFVFQMEYLKDIVVWLATGAILISAFFALAQKDLKRMLTYVLISEVGYMVGGAWLGNRAGMTGSILHIINDGLMTFCVFLAATALASKIQLLHLDNLKGLFRKMPFTMGAFVVGGLSMIGVPPTCGFFSKWYLVSGGILAGQYQFVAALILSSLINIVLFFRIFEISYFEPFSEGHGHAPEPIAEAHWGLVVILLLVAAGLVAVGLFTGEIIGGVISHAIPESVV